MAQTLEETTINAIALIKNMEATPSDLAFIFLMSEFIDAIGQDTFKAGLRRMEQRWQVAQGEYARGEV